MKSWCILFLWYESSQRAEMKNIEKKKSYTKKFVKTHYLHSKLVHFSENKVGSEFDFWDEISILYVDCGWFWQSWINMINR